MKDFSERFDITLKHILKRYKNMCIKVKPLEHCTFFNPQIITNKGEYSFVLNISKKNSYFNIICCNPRSSIILKHQELRCLKNDASLVEALKAIYISYYQKQKDFYINLKNYIAIWDEREQNTLLPIKVKVKEQIFKVWIDVRGLTHFCLDNHITLANLDNVIYNEDALLDNLIPDSNLSDNQLFIQRIIKGE